MGVRERWVKLFQKKRVCWESEEYIEVEEEEFMRRNQKTNRWSWVICDENIRKKALSGYSWGDKMGNEKSHHGAVARRT